MMCSGMTPNADKPWQVPKWGDERSSFLWDRATKVEWGFYYRDKSYVPSKLTLIKIKYTSGDEAGYAAERAKKAGC
jgi:hypothetical protein